MGKWRGGEGTGGRVKGQGKAAGEGAGGTEGRLNIIIIGAATGAIGASRGPR